jgi:hypothetical protein
MLKSGTTDKQSQALFRRKTNEKAQVIDDVHHKLRRHIRASKSESTVGRIYRGVIDACMQSTSVIIAAELLEHSAVIPKPPTVNGKQ